jgi:outer membrane protein OmpA-like peptidoglycan-associated protein
MDMRSLTTRSLLAIGALAAALVADAGCGGDDQHASCPTSAEPGLAVVLGARANSPAPAIPAVVGNYLTDIKPGNGVTVVRVDGSPSISCAATFRTDGRNDVARKQDQHDFGTSLQSAIETTKAVKPEADPLGALDLAASAAGPGGTVVFVDSGLQTKPPLDFRNKATLFIPPSRIVEQLRSSDLLPDLNGKKVVLAGIGWTANPQKEPSGTVRRHLIAVWTAIAKAGGGDVQVIDQPNTSAAPGGVPDVSSIPLPDPADVQPACDSEITLPDNGSVGFEPDRAVYRDAEKAKTTLLAVADWMGDNPGATVTATGTVAHYGANAPDAGLALDRARTVTGTLADLGADRGHLIAHGGGWGPYEGNGDAIDQKNRRVVLRINC